MTPSRETSVTLLGVPAWILTSHLQSKFRRLPARAYGMIKFVDFKWLTERSLKINNTAPPPQPVLCYSACGIYCMAAASVYSALSPEIRWRSFASTSPVKSAGLHSELHDCCHLKSLLYRDGNFRRFDFVNFACVLLYSGIQEGS